LFEKAYAGFDDIQIHRLYPVGFNDKTGSLYFIQHFFNTTKLYQLQKSHEWMILNSD